jgi:hypothetical protein
MAMKPRSLFAFGKLTSGHGAIGAMRFLRTVARNEERRQQTAAINRWEGEGGSLGAASRQRAAAVLVQ